MSHPDNPDISVGLGTQDRTPASRSGHFAAGVMSHAIGSDGLAEAQARYAQIVPREYQRAGVIAMTTAVPSSISVGLAPDDPRSGLFLGRRYVMTPGNGRSASTSQAQPVFEEDV